jgi:acetyl-CoA synthetase
LHITALGTLKYIAIFCPLFSVLAMSLFIKECKGDATVLFTTSKLYEKHKTIEWSSLFPLYH